MTKDAGLENLFKWQEEKYSSDKKIFSFEDSKTFWDAISKYLGRQIHRTGVSVYNTVSFELDDDFVLQIRMPSDKAKLVARVLPFDWSDKKEWEASVSEEQELEKASAKKPKKEKKTKSKFDDEDSEMNNDGGAEIEETDSDEEEYGDGGGASQRRGSGGRGSGDGESYGESGGSYGNERGGHGAEDENAVPDDPATEGKKSRKSKLNISKFLNKNPIMKELPTSIKDSIAVWFQQMGTDEYIQKQVEKTDFFAYEEKPMDLGGMECVMLSLYSVKDDYKEYLGIIGSQNVNQLASKKTDFGNQNKSEAVLLQKIDSGQDAYVIVYGEGYKNKIFVTKF